MLVFGGTDSSGAYLNDVWDFSNATGLGSTAWSMLSPTGTPPAARSGHAAIFDSANQRMTIFAGNNTSGVLNDVRVMTAPGASGLSCNANSGAPNIVRADGITERVGDAVLLCTGGTPTPLGEPIPQYQVTMTLNTNVTSLPLPEASELSEAVLTIDDPFPANPSPSSATPFPGESSQILCTPLGSTCAETGTGGSPSPYQTQPNVFVGKQIGPQALEWTVPIDPPGVDQIRVIRLTNVRANANELGLSNNFIPTELNATLAIEGTAPVPLANPQPIVALGEAGLITAVVGNPIPQCQPHNAGLLERSNGSAFDFTVQMQEGFGYAFLYRNYGAFLFGPEFPEPLAEQNILGWAYRTESGFYSPSLFTAAPSLGLADFGTRIRVEFGPLAAGTHLFVPTTITMTGDYAFGEGGPHGQVRLVKADDNGLSSSGYSPARATAMVGNTPVAEVEYARSNAFATYEVVYSDPSVTETASIPVAVAFRNSPGTGQVNVTPSFAPLNAAETASSSAPLPRFTELYAAQPAFSIDSCSALMMSASIASKTGPRNARVWNLQVDAGAVADEGAQIESFTLAHTSGPKCSPSITSPSSPVSLGDIPANGSASTPVTINFAGCANSSKFTASIGLSANGGVSNTTVVLKKQEF